MNRRTRRVTLLLIGTLALAQSPCLAGEAIDDRLHPWLLAQRWQRDTEQPVLRLGRPGAFDDTHVFAPCVIRTEDIFQMWYCGSRGRVEDRVFSLGQATSRDGRVFERFNQRPVFSFGDGKHSVLTPTLLRDTDGTATRENGKLRMWFSASHLGSSTGLHTLHEATSEDGIHWSAPSSAQLQHVYAPSILKDTSGYRLWYTDVSREPWVIRHAFSPDGRQWQVGDEPVLELDQPWESGRLFYPTVLKVDEIYLMWYGSYWSTKQSKTALGFAVSLDGLEWHKNPHNPVLRPDPSRSWESHYTTSQSVVRSGNGSFRIWYATRKKPPFVNKYFAIGTATWAGLE